MEGTEQKKPGFGALYVSSEVLAGALHLPEGYRIVGMDCDPRNRSLILTLMSDELPEAEEGAQIPTVSLLATVHYVPPEYRKITTEVKL
jgi:hypothetical protein